MDGEETARDPESWPGTELDRGLGDIQAERGFIQHWCEAVQNGNPLYWNPEVAERIVGDQIAPQTMLSVWMRPLHWGPSTDQRRRPLELHFRLKDSLGFPDAIVVDNEIYFGSPVTIGTKVRTIEKVESVSELKTNKLGQGRYWTISVEYQDPSGTYLGSERYTLFGYGKVED